VQGVGTQRDDGIKSTEHREVKNGVDGSHPDPTAKDRVIGDPCMFI
jgi:hypothetical protein